MLPQPQWIIATSFLVKYDYPTINHQFKIKHKNHWCYALAGNVVRDIVQFFCGNVQEVCAHHNLLFHKDLIKILSSLLITIIIIWLTVNNRWHHMWHHEHVINNRWRISKQDYLQTTYSDNWSRCAHSLVFLDKLYFKFSKVEWDQC